MPHNTFECAPLPDFFPSISMDPALSDYQKVFDVDVAEISRILQANDLPAEVINGLHIHFLPRQEDAGGDSVAGEYLTEALSITDKLAVSRVYNLDFDDNQYRYLINIYIKPDDKPEDVNDVIEHELKHFIQDHNDKPEDDLISEDDITSRSAFFKLSSAFGVFIMATTFSRLSGIHEETFIEPDVLNTLTIKYPLPALAIGYLIGGRPSIQYFEYFFRVEEIGARRFARKQKSQIMTISHR